MSHLSLLGLISAIHLGDMIMLAEVALGKIRRWVLVSSVESGPAAAVGHTGLLWAYRSVQDAPGGDTLLSVPALHDAPLYVVRVKKLLFRFVFQRLLLEQRPQATVCRARQMVRGPSWPPASCPTEMRVSHLPPQGRMSSHRRRCGTPCRWCVLRWIPPHHGSPVLPPPPL